MQKSIYFLLCKYNILYIELFNILLLSAQFLSFFLLGVGRDEAMRVCVDTKHPFCYQNWGEGGGYRL